MQMYKILTLVAAGSVAGILAAASSTAEAKHYRVHATDCTAISSSEPYNVLYQSGFGSHGALIAHGGGTDLTCPISDENTFEKDEIATLNVHGSEWTTTGYARAQACRTSWWGGTGWCGASSSSSWAGTGHFTLTPSLSQWSPGTYADFGWIFVELPGSPGTPSQLRGYYAAD